MSARYPGVRFSIRLQGERWVWSASLDEVVLAEGEAGTREIAAAHVIKTICEVSVSIGAAAPTQARAA